MAFMRGIFDNLPMFGVRQHTTSISIIFFWYFLFYLTLQRQFVSSTSLDMKRNFLHPQDRVLFLPSANGMFKIESNPLERATGNDLLSLERWSRQRRTRPKRQMGDFGEIEGPCRSFKEGDPVNKMFYSPNYPNNYTNHTDCVRVIEAPKGHLLKLDFRDGFAVEPSEGCKFDYLEVRDGAHGYSRLLGQFCGTNFPPLISSSDRYLWLRFHSDDNYEMAGFKAVYEYIPRPSSSPPELEMCQINVDGSEGIINKTKDIPEDRLKMAISYNMPLDCMWVITVREGWKIQLTFKDFKLEQPNDCESNFVDVFSDRTDLPSRLKNFCGSIADSVTSRNNIMFIRFSAEAQAINSTFNAFFTAFRERNPGQNCEEDEYDCQDNTCIDKSLLCNGRTNCRYRWDETECVPKKQITSEHIIIIMVIFCLIVSGMCAAFIFNCVRKLMRDHRLIQDHLRQSRENRLDQAGSNPKKKHMSSKDDLKRSTISLIVPNPSAAVVSSMSPPPPPPIPPPGVPGGNGGQSSYHHRPAPPPHHRSRSNSTQSSGSQHFPPTAASSENPCCYGTVGGVMRQDLIPILKEDSIGTSMDNIASEMEPGTMPEMCDSACQTRESLFQPTTLRSMSSLSSDTSNNIHLHHHDHHHPHTHHHHSHHHHHNNNITPFHRAEVAIEVQKQQSPADTSSPSGPSSTTSPIPQSSRRPYSVQTTKSAPDVIVTH